MRILIALLAAAALCLALLLMHPPACRKAVDISGFKVFGC